MKFSLGIDESKFRSKIEKMALEKIKAGTRRGMNRVILAVKAKAVSLAPVVTGTLRRSMTVKTQGHGFNVVGILKATARNESGTVYAGFVHDGTGIYGPRKDFIRGLSGFGGTIFFSKGQRPQPFYTDAIKALENTIPELFLEGFKSATGE